MSMTDTVERNILDLAAKQGLSLYAKENASGSLNVTSLTVDARKTQIDSPATKAKQKGDFIFRCVCEMKWVTQGY